MKRFWSKVNKAGPVPPHHPELGSCWVWTGATVRGRGMSFFGGKPVMAHRVSFYLAHGRWPSPCCLHRCDNPACVNSDHLFEGTQLDNVEDRDAKCRQARGENHGSRTKPECTLRGENHPRAKLSRIGVEEIRRRREAGEKNSDLAVEFGVSARTVRDIVRRRVWLDV